MRLNGFPPTSPKHPQQLPDISQHHVRLLSTVLVEIPISITRVRRHHPHPLRRPDIPSQAVSDHQDLGGVPADPLLPRPTPLLLIIHLRCLISFLLSSSKVPVYRLISRNSVTCRQSQFNLHRRNEHARNNSGSPRPHP